MESVPENVHVVDATVVWPQFNPELVAPVMVMPFQGDQWLGLAYAHVTVPHFGTTVVVTVVFVVVVVVVEVVVVVVPVPVVVVVGNEQFLPLTDVYPLIQAHENVSGFVSFPVHSVYVPQSVLQSLTKITTGQQIIFK